jgi:hypothetical protein
MVAHDPVLGRATPLRRPDQGCCRHLMIPIPTAPNWLMANGHRRPKRKTPVILTNSESRPIRQSFYAPLPYTILIPSAV